MVCENALIISTLARATILHQLVATTEITLFQSRQRDAPKSPFVAAHMPSASKLAV